MRASSRALAVTTSLPVDMTSSAIDWEKRACGSSPC